MNKDFLRPLIIAIITVILTGVLAWVIPEHHSHIFTIRKMPWFSALKRESTEVDSIYTGINDLEHTQEELVPFLNKLNNLEPKSRRSFGAHDRNLRVAYFGDSLIEGDLITATLRSSLQSEYGGKGVGFMPITSIVSGFRQTIKHEFSRNWESISFMNHGKADISLGISGYTFIPRAYYTSIQVVETVRIDSVFNTMDSLNVADSLNTQLTNTKEVAPTPKSKEVRTYVDYDPWVEYRAMDIAGGAARFDKIRLFYSNASYASTFTCAYDSGEPISYRLETGNGLKIIDISAKQPVKKIRLTFPAENPVYLYGVSFDQDEGIFVDNFPVRGFSGMYFQRIHANILAQFQKALNYDLIVMQYGGNVSNQKVTSYENYKLMMIRTITHIQEAMPNVPILIVGMHDRSVKIDGEYKTSPDIPLLIRAQSEMASETGAGFFNLFEAMGGYNSMISYVNQNPPLASKDYTHFTRLGADKIAHMLLDFLFER